MIGPEATQFTTEPPFGGAQGRLRHREKQRVFSLRFLRVSVSLWLLISGLTSASSAQQIHFRDITAQAGIHFTHNNGAFGKKWLPETMGPGCAFIDYDLSLIHI